MNICFTFDHKIYQLPGISSKTGWGHPKIGKINERIKVTNEKKKLQKLSLGWIDWIGLNLNNFLSFDHFNVISYFNANQTKVNAA